MVWFVGTIIAAGAATMGVLLRAERVRIQTTAAAARPGAAAPGEGAVSASAPRG